MCKIGQTSTLQKILFDSSEILVPSPGDDLDFPADWWCSAGWLSPLHEHWSRCRGTSTTLPTTKPSGWWPAIEMVILGMIGCTKVYHIGNGVFFWLFFRGEFCGVHRSGVHLVWVFQDDLAMAAMGHAGCVPPRTWQPWSMMAATSLQWETLMGLRWQRFKKANYSSYRWWYRYN